MKKTLLSLLLFIPFIGFGQVVISNFSTASTQDFNSLANSGTGMTNAWTQNSTILGWYAYKAGGTAAVTTYDAGTGSANSGQLYSFGASAATERALGSTSSGTPGTFLYGLRVKNSTGALVKSVTVSYTGEQWRDGGSTTPVAQLLTFDYLKVATFTDFSTGTYVNIPELTFSSPIFTSTAGALDGNATANRTAKSQTFNVDIPINEEIILRWTDINDPGNDHGLAVDDFSVTFFSTLPISLTSFTGKAIDQSVLLNWETASESNNEYFEVLKSINGKSFTAIGTVKGSGTTTDAKSYSLVDNNPAAGTNYYQLVQYDFDGKSSKSDVIPVNSAIASSSLTVYAAASSVNVSINSANATDGTLQIFDITGKKLNETKLSLSKGFNTLSLLLSLNSGIHVVNFVTGSEVIKTKFIKD
jgi:hypothetical protein